MYPHFRNPPYEKSKTSRWEPVLRGLEFRTPLKDLEFLRGASQLRPQCGHEKKVFANNNWLCGYYGYYGHYVVDDG